MSCYPSIQHPSVSVFLIYHERCPSSWFEMIAELIVCRLSHLDVDRDISTAILSSGDGVD